MKNDIHKEKKPLVILISAFFLSFILCTQTAFASELSKNECSDGISPNDISKRAQMMAMDIVEAAMSSDIQNMRFVLEQNELWPMTKMGANADEARDPIKSWIDQSPDEDGAWLLNQLPILLTSPAREQALGSRTKLYIWPNFAEKKLNQLCEDELELIKQLNGAEIFEKMDQDKAYSGFQLAIADNGVWHYFMRKNVE